MHREELDVLFFTKDKPLTIEIPEFEQRVSHESESGRKTFAISHKGNYLAHYALLGEPHCMLLMKEGNYVASVVFVKRKIGENVFWYIDDFKIAEAYRTKYAFQVIAQSRRAFEQLVQNDPFMLAVIVAEGSKMDDRLLLSYTKCMGKKMEKMGHLYEFTVSSEQFERVRPVIEKHRGPITGYLSLEGLRDFSVNNVAHTDCLQVQYGPLSICNAKAEDFANPLYSFLSPENDGLTKELTQMGLSPFIKLYLAGYHLPFDPVWLLGQDI